MCFPTLDQAIASMRMVYDRLTQEAQASGSRRHDLEEGLQDRVGQPVEVWTLPAQAFVAPSPTSPPQQRNATGMFYDGRYIIFMSDTIIPDGWWPPQLSGVWAEHFIVWHEAGHILNGEVFEDNPQARYELMRRAHNGDSQARQELQQSEVEADNIAIAEVVAKANKDQNAELATELGQAAQLRSGGGS